MECLGNTKRKNTAVGNGTPVKRGRLEEPGSSRRNEVTIAEEEQSQSEELRDEATTARQDAKLQILSKELIYDKNLILSNSTDCVKKIISDSLRLIDVKNEDGRLDFLNEKVLYPNDYVFVSLANRMYEEESNILGNRSHLYGTQFDAIIGNWQLLTVAHNKSRTNGYVGAAYWNPDMQQLIISHRGTVPLDNSVFGTVINTDIKSICLNQPSGQINSAVTFTYKIISVLKEINEDCRLGRKSEPYIQLFFTGHSLGGWLAQITTFSAKYIVRAGDNFVKSGNFEETGYHASAVVFDSPGCRNMLERIQDRLMNRCSSSLVHSLDIISYQSAPNLVNTCNPHVGKVYRIFITLSETQKNRMRKSSLSYTYYMHQSEMIKKAFDPETGKVHKDEEGKLRIVKVQDWPILRSGDEVAPIRHKFVKAGKIITELVVPKPIIRIIETLYKGYSSVKWYNEFKEELKKFFSLANDSNNYHLTDENTGKINLGENSYRDIRYDAQVLNENYKNEHSINVFTESEQQFLDTYKRLVDNQSSIPDEYKFESLFSSLKRNKNLKIKTMEVLEGYKIQNMEKISDVKEIHSTNLQEFIPYIKRLLHFFPKIKSEVEKAQRSLPIHVLRTVFQNASSAYVESFQTDIDFKDDTLKLSDFFKNNGLKVLHLVQTYPLLGAMRVNSIFKKVQSAYGNKKNHIFLSLTRISNSKESLLIGFLRKVKYMYLLVIECDNAAIDKWAGNFLNELFKTLLHKPNIKVILITERDCDLNNYISNIININELNNFCKSNDDAELRFSDMTFASQNELLKKDIIFQGKKVILSGILGRHLNTVDGNRNLDEILDLETIDALVNNKKIEVGKALPNLGSMESYYIHRKLVKKVKINEELFKENDSLNDLFFISNISKDAFSKLVKGEKRKFMKEDINKVYIVNDRFIFLDGPNEDKKFGEMCRKYDNQQYNFHWIKKKNEDFIWQSSRGQSLSGLRRYIENCGRELEEEEYSMENNSIHMVDVDTVNTFKEKFVIVTAEPGMGKTTALTHLSSNKADDEWIIRINLNEYKEKLAEFDFRKVEDIVKFIHKNITTLSPFAKKLLTSRLNIISQIIFILDGFDEITSDSQKNIINLLKTLQGTDIGKVLISTRVNLREELENSLSTFAYTFKPFFERDQEEFLKKYWQKVLDTNNDRDFFESYIKNVLKFISDAIGDKVSKFMGIPLQMRMVADAFQERLQNSLFSFQCFNQRPIFPEKCDMLDLYDRFIEVKYRIYFEKIGGGNINLNSGARKDFLMTRATEIHGMLAFEEMFGEIALETSGILRLEKPISEARKQELNLMGIVQFINGKAVFTHRTFAEYFASSFLIRILNKKNTQEYKAILKLLANELFQTKNEVINTFLDYRLAKEEQTLISALRGSLNDMEENASVDIKDALGRNALHYAAQGGHKEMVNLLLKKNSNVKTVDELGKTALHYSARYNDRTEVVSLLIENGRTITTELAKEFINIRDKNGKNGCNAIFYAAQQDNWDIVDRIIKVKAASLAGIDKEKLLFHYAYKGDLTKLKKTVKQVRGEIDIKSVKDSRGNTLLHYASKNGGEGVVNFLVKSGADVCITNDIDERPIQCAARNSHWAVVNILEEHGANIHDLNMEQKRLFKDNTRDLRSRNQKKYFSNRNRKKRLIR